MAETIKIGGELESMATGKIVAAASAIKDKTRNKTQETINGDVERAFSEQSEQFQRLSEETAESVSSAENAARQSKQYLADLKEAITDLPDGQAVSAQVAINQVDIARLKSDIVVDLSVRYSASYANLSAALTALNSDTATDASAIKKGGVSIKFINSTTNKYEQWVLKASSFSATESDWVSVTNVKAEDVSYGSSNVKEELDKIQYVTRENTQSEDEEFRFETENGTLIGKVTPQGADFTNLKKNGVNVATENQLPTIDDNIENSPSETNVPTSKAVADYVNEHGGNDHESTESTEELVELQDSNGNVIFSFNSEGLHTNCIFDTDGNVLFSKPGLLWIGDSTSQMPNRILGNWSMVNDKLYIPEIFGGQTAVHMGMHIGVVGMRLANNIVIPSAANSTISIQCQRGLTDDGNFSNVSALAGFNDNPPYYEHHGVNPVRINGVYGNLGAANTNLRTFCLYDSNHALIFSTIGTDSTYGNGQTNNIDLRNCKYLRVAINATSSSDVSNSTVHVDINSEPVEIKTHITIANKAFDNTGAEITQVGFYCSEYIDITQYIDPTHTTESVYKDGLGTGAQTFTRLNVGEEVYAESGAFVYSDFFNFLRKRHVVVLYLNNIALTVPGDSIAEKIYNQVAPILNNAKDGMFVFAMSHYMAHDYTSEQIDDIDYLMTTMFGNKYINMYRYMSQYGVTDGIKYGLFTQSQVEGYTWEQVLSTGSTGDIGGTVNVHENKYGAYLIVRRILETCGDLGYFPVGDISVNSIFNNANFLPNYKPWYLN